MSALTLRLSKSKFLSGLQCHKRLYFEIHQPELATEPDEQTQAILDMGTEVGGLARQRFPGGVLVEVDYRHPTEALQRTAELLSDPTVPAIFEGAFEFDQVLVRVDILERVTSGQDGAIAWRLIEVKSSTKVKDVHMDDVAIQTFVVSGAGVALSGSCLMHINTQYVYPGGELDLERLFVVQDLTALTAARQSYIPRRLAEMKAVLLDLGPPAIEPDGHCHQPYECPFWDHCIKDKSPRWVYYLPGGDRAVQQFVRNGIETIDEIPPQFKLSVIQRRMKDNVEWIGPSLRAALQAVRYPVHHLDFETFMPCIPRYSLTRPYQTIPTQWSNHVETEDGQVLHHEYLCLDPKDPRGELAMALLESVGQEGTICVYSAYERSVLERLTEALPALRGDLEQVIGRLWDLYTVIHDNYYHPDFQGKLKIKSVLPAVVPSLGYSDLAIQEGAVAALQYYRMVFEETDWVERMRIREDLLKYCARDTLAMLELRKALLSKVLTL